MNGWLVFLALLAAYVGVAYLLRRRGGKAGGAELNGPFIMFRTQFGKKTIEKIARPKRFWEVVADVGIVATWVTGIALLLLLVYNLVLYLSLPPQVVADSARPAREFIGLPGVNPLIPLGWGLVALVVALVIHEGSHGVMAYVGRMRVKSLGLLFFIVPIGAFVEPDEEDLEKATAREKNRVFAAGPASNLVVALIAGLLLSGLLVSSVGVVNGGQGVAVLGTVEGSGAEAAGLQPGDVLVALRGVTIHEEGRPPVVRDIVLTNGTIYSDALAKTRAGERLTVDYVRDGARASTVVTLTDRYEQIARTNPDAVNETDRGKGFMGVSQLPLRGTTLSPGLWYDILKNPFRDGFPQSFATSTDQNQPGSFFLFIAYPFFVFQTQLDLFAEPYRDFLVFGGPLDFLPVGAIAAIATILYWIIWINLMLGTFNALPAGPLDGGQMLRATLRERLMRRYKVDRAQVEVERVEMGGAQMRGKDPETQAKLDRIQLVLRKTTWTLGLFILALILLPIFGPQLARLFV